MQFRIQTLMTVVAIAAGYLTAWHAWPDARLMILVNSAVTVCLVLERQTWRRGPRSFARKVARVMVLVALIAAAIALKIFLPNLREILERCPG